jgi:hypothetical protein
MLDDDDCVRCTKCDEPIARDSDCSCVLVLPPLATAMATSIGRWAAFCSYRCLRNWLNSLLREDDRQVDNRRRAAP